MSGISSYSDDYLTIEKVEKDKIYMRLEFVEVLGYKYTDLYTRLILFPNDSVKFNLYQKNPKIDFRDIPILTDVLDTLGSNRWYGDECFELPDNLREYAEQLKSLYGRFFLFGGQIFEEIMLVHLQKMRDEVIDNCLNGQLETSHRHKSII